MSNADERRTGDAPPDARPDEYNVHGKLFERASHLTVRLSGGRKGPSAYEQSLIDSSSELSVVRSAPAWACTEST